MANLLEPNDVLAWLRSWWGHLPAAPWSEPQHIHIDDLRIDHWGPRAAEQLLRESADFVLAAGVWAVWVFEHAGEDLGQRVPQGFDDVVALLNHPAETPPALYVVPWSLGPAVGHGLLIPDLMREFERRGLAWKPFLSVYDQRDADEDHPYCSNLQLFLAGRQPTADAPPSPL